MGEDCYNGLVGTYDLLCKQEGIKDVQKVVLFSPAQSSGKEEDAQSCILKGGREGTGECIHLISRGSIEEKILSRRDIGITSKDL